MKAQALDTYEQIYDHYIHHEHLFSLYIVYDSQMMNHLPVNYPKSTSYKA